MSYQVYLGLGGNLGNPLATFHQAIQQLRQLPVHLSCASGLYETDAIGGPDRQPHYLNAVIAITTVLSPRSLLSELLRIERQLGRQRAVRWEPRNLDLDLLLVDDQIFDEPNLVVPHPRLHERRFVLQPLSEIASHFIHPCLNQTIGELLVDLKCSVKSVRRVGGSEWTNSGYSLPSIAGWSAPIAAPGFER